MIAISRDYNNRRGILSGRLSARGFRGPVGHRPAVLSGGNRLLPARIERIYPALGIVYFGGEIGAGNGERCGTRKRRQGESGLSYCGLFSGGSQPKRRRAHYYDRRSSPRQAVWPGLEDADRGGGSSAIRRMPQRLPGNGSGQPSGTRVLQAAPILSGEDGAAVLRE